jgi:hypothetical protein
MPNIKNLMTIEKSSKLRDLVTLDVTRCSVFRSMIFDGRAAVIIGRGLLLGLDELASFRASLLDDFGVESSFLGAFSSDSLFVFTSPAGTVFFPEESVEPRA